MKQVTHIPDCIRAKDLDAIMLRPVIIRVGPINDDTAKIFQDEMSRAHATGQSVIPIVIDSSGGLLYSMMTMISVIRSSSVPIATVCLGRAFSAGAILFSFGAEGMRYASPDATFMIHEISAGTMGKTEEISADSKQISRMNRKVMASMSENCGQPKDYFKQKIHEKGHADWFLNSQEAKTHNLVNHIKVPTFQTTIEVTTSMTAD